VPSATKATYSSFFDVPVKSTFVQKAEKMNATIHSLEDAAVAQKSWTMGGEVNKMERPLNSLLEEDLIFEHATKMAPVITEEVTMSLEDVIKKRIMDVCYA
jgi:U3 small nucleolar RNA-associated protein MPP10